MLEVSLTRRSASVRRPSPQVRSCEPTTAAGWRTAVRIRTSRPVCSAARRHSGSNQAACGSLMTTFGSAWALSQSRSSASTAPSSSRAATRSSARGLPSLGRTRAPRIRRLWNSITHRGSKWPLALRSEAGTSGCGTCQPRCLRLPASELVPLRMEPVTRTTLCSIRLPFGRSSTVCSVIVSHEHGFVFMKTRKTAGTSVEIALSRVCGEDDVITPVTETTRCSAGAKGGRGPQHYESPPNLRAQGVQPHAGLDGPQDAGSEEVRVLPLLRDRAEPLGRRGLALPLAVPRLRARLLSGEYVASEAVATFATKNQRIYRIKGEVAVDRVLRYESLDTDLATVWSELWPARHPRAPPRQARLPAARSVVPLRLRRRVTGAGGRAVRRPDRGARLRVRGWVGFRRVAENGCPEWDSTGISHYSTRT